jgi:hypothetical protein
MANRHGCDSGCDRGKELTMEAIRRAGEIRLHDTHVDVCEEHVDEAAMQVVWRSVRAHLERRGFTLGPVERVVQIAKAHAPKGKRARERDKAWSDAWIENYRHGRKGELELEGETVGRTLKVEFFQNVANVSNPNGGRYDFDKFARMPRTLRLRAVVEMVALIRHLQSLGYTLGGDLRDPLMQSVVQVAEGRVEEGLTPLQRLNRSWGAHRERRAEDGWPERSDFNVYGYKDKDGRTCAPGEVRYIYHRARLVSGFIYPHMNNMCSVHSADGTPFAWVNAGELFTADAETPRRKPLTKQERVSKLDTALRRALLRKDDRRAERVRGAMAKLTDERLYYVLSLKHSKSSDGVLTWWGPNNGGYGFRLELAGKYLESVIDAHPSYYNGEHGRAIPCEVVEARAKMVRDVDVDAVDRKPATDHVVLYRHRRSLKAWKPASTSSEAA